MRNSKLKIPALLCVCAMLCCILVGCAGKQASDEPATSGQSEPIDISDYMNKIWVIDDYRYGDHEYRFSFYISGTHDGIISGRFLYDAYSVAGPEFFWKERPADMGDWGGTLHGNAANCVFVDREWPHIDHGNQNRGYNGNMTLVFSDENRIDVNIAFTGEEDIHGFELVGGDYHYRPYNISDYSDFAEETQAYSIELENWGRVELVTVLIAGHSWYYRGFLTDDRQNILYEFHTLDDEIYEPVISDLNGDGLTDIRVEYKNGGAIFEWLQRDDGLFSARSFYPED